MVMDMSLDERKRRILESVIKDYVETAEPVGSRAVVRRHTLNISAATVRNEMADLEDMGYLEQPHTSAGRIPSEMGFRYYVDWMMEKEGLGEEGLSVLYNILRQGMQDWEEVVQSVAQYLSQITQYTAFVIVPSIKFGHFHFLQIVPLQEGQAVVLLVTDTGFIMHRKITIPPDISAIDLQVIGGLLSQVLHGRKLVDLQRSDLQVLREELNLRRQVIDKALEVINELLDSSSQEKLIVSGVLNILKEPEFKDLDKLKSILNIFEEDVILKSLLPEEVNEEVDIRIGKENFLAGTKEISLVFTGYRSAGQMGKIGLLGPVRMEYWKAAGAIEAVRDLVQEFLKSD